MKGGASSPACEIRSLFVAPSDGGSSPRAVKACCTHIIEASSPGKSGNCSAEEASEVWEQFSGAQVSRANSFL